MKIELYSIKVLFKNRKPAVHQPKWPKCKITLNEKGCLFKEALVDLTTKLRYCIQYRYKEVALLVHTCHMYMFYIWYVRLVNTTESKSASRK